MWKILRTAQGTLGARKVAPETALALLPPWKGYAATASSEHRPRVFPRSRPFSRTRFGTSTSLTRTIDRPPAISNSMTTPGTPGVKSSKKATEATFLISCSTGRSERTTAGRLFSAGGYRQRRRCLEATAGTRRYGYWRGRGFRADSKCLCISFEGELQFIEPLDRVVPAVLRIPKPGGLLLGPAK